MKSFNRLLVAIPGALIIATSGALAGSAVKESELKSLFAGGTLYTTGTHSFFTPTSFVLKFKANGTMSVNYSLQPVSDRMNPIEKTDSGTWQVRSNDMCVKFNQLFKAAQHCFTVHKATKAPKLYGSHMYRATMVETGQQWLFAIDK